MTTALQPFVPSNLAELDSLCEKLAKSSLVPEALRGKPADVAIVVMTGNELGLPPMLSLRSIYVVKGRPTLSADLMGALVQRSQVCEYLMLVESTADKAVYETKRRGAPKPTRLTWTMAQAKAAGLTANKTWSAYPDAMLRARCLSALVRVAYPDLMAGIYDPDELGAPSQPSYVEATIIEPPPVQVDQRNDEERLAEFVAEMAAAQTLADLNSVAARVRDANPSQDARQRLGDIYSKRRAELSQPAATTTPEAANE